MKKSAARLGLAGLGLAAILGSTPAFALESSTTGSYAYTSSIKFGNDTAKVKDNKADSRSAYGQYYRKNEPGVQKALWNKSGSNTTVASTHSFASVYQIRACRQEQMAEDTCGPFDA